MWNDIRRRCLHEQHPEYFRYGGRGITIHPDWANDPRPFITWIEEHLGPRPEGMSIDRIDNDGSYEPGNLRWATPSEQVRNRRPFSSTGFKGVQPSSTGNRWEARITVEGKKVFLGSFLTPEEASVAYEAERERRGL
jgi:hypothetical protein